MNNNANDCQKIFKFKFTWQNKYLNKNYIIYLFTIGHHCLLVSALLINGCFSSGKLPEEVSMELYVAAFLRDLLFLCFLASVFSRNSDITNPMNPVRMRTIPTNACHEGRKWWIMRSTTTDVGMAVMVPTLGMCVWGNVIIIVNKKQPGYTYVYRDNHTRNVCAVAILLTLGGRGVNSDWFETRGGPTCVYKFSHCGHVIMFRPNALNL